MPNGLKIEHLCDIILKAQSLLCLNLPVFLFVAFISTYPDQNNRFGYKCIREKDLLIRTDRHLCLCFCSCQLGLYSVSYTTNKYSFYHFCIMIKAFSISFSRVIIVQDFETVTFYVLFVYTFSVIFCCMKKVPVLGQFNSLFILYISTAKPFSLSRGYIEVKINKHEIWSALIQLTLRCLKYIKGIFNSCIVWHSYFLIPRQSFYGKRAKSLEEIFFQL